ncbi:MAG: DMT family transporter [Actinomycetales bacterium]|nr:DMT family transporter [Actinomycetales bacterium]
MHAISSTDPDPPTDSVARHVDPRHLSIWSWAGLAGLTIGALSAGQSRMNGTLSSAFAEPLYAALWNFGSGWVLLTLVLVGSSRTRAGLRAIITAVRGRRLLWWQAIGGLLGATYVLVQSFAVPLAGVALFTVGVVGGQTGSGVIVDRFGLGPSGRSRVTAVRVGAAVVATVGVAIAVSGRFNVASSAVLLPVALAVVVGGLQAVQSAINGQVNVVTGTPWATAWLNFTLGLALLGVLAVVRLAGGSLSAPVVPVVPTAAATPWWVWFGGVIGVVFVGVVAVVVRHLGVLHTMLVLLTGQLGAAMAIDLISPATRHTVDVVVVTGLVVTAFGAALPTLRTWVAGTRRRPSPDAHS